MGLVRADYSTPGVSVGQTAHYTVSGTDAGGTVTSLFTVSSVTGTNVSFTDVDTQSDNATTTDYLWVDINSGPKFASSGDYFIISPNKQVGQCVYSDYHFCGNPPKLPIQDLTTRNYAGSNRQTVHVRAQNQTQVNPSPSSPYTYEDYYWDQQTGMFTEILKTEQGSTATLLHIVLDSTTMWQGDNPLSALNTSNAILTLMSAGLVAIVIVGGFTIRRRRRRWFPAVGTCQWVTIDQQRILENMSTPRDRISLWGLWKKLAEPKNGKSRAFSFSAG